MVCQNIDISLFQHYKGQMLKMYNYFNFLLSISLVGCSLPTVSYNPTILASNTSTQAIIPTQNPSPSPTSTPTPPPEIRVENGDHALFNGDYDQARQDYLTALNSSSDIKIKATGYDGLAKVEFKNGNFDQSLIYLNRLITEIPEAPEIQDAYFLQAQCYDSLKMYSEAAESYAKYLSVNPGLIDSYVNELRGDSLSNSGDYSSALIAYQSSIQAPRVGDTYPLKLKEAQMYTTIGDLDSSLSLYNDILSTTSSDYIKAQMDFLIGQVYLNLGQPEQAYGYFQDTVSKYPTSYDSYSSLVALVEAGIPVDDLDRGLVDFFAGQYGVALDAFNRYLLVHPDHDGTVLHYLALALRENGEYQQAIDNWGLLINNYPENRFWESAWTDRAKTMWSNLNDYQGAAQSLLDYVNNYPSNSNAPFNLNYAARIQDWDDQLQRASDLWQRLAQDYPGSELVPDAFFNAGIELYRLAAYDKALIIFQKDLILSSLPADQARTYLWIGKSQLALGDKESSQQSWQLAASLDPTGYYSERARDLLLGKTIFEAPANYNLTFNPFKERSEAESWIRVTFNLPADTDLTGLGNLSTDARLIRGTELWKLGLLDLARNEFEDLRGAVSESPIDTYRLANYMVELGLYRIAIASSRQLLKLAGLETYTQMLVAPQYFNHINYGVYYQDLVEPISKEFNLNSLFLFSMIAQESSFEGFVHSSVGARGLMQIMPATGQERADTLGWPVNFIPDDLYRANVSIRLGASYLSKNLLDFNGNYFAALSAYNAGPGYALSWENLAGSDPDLYIEVVRFTNSDPFDYIWNIYEIYIVYRSIYGSNQ